MLRRNVGLVVRASFLGLLALSTSIFVTHSVLDRGETPASATVQSTAFAIGQENSWIRVQNIGAADAHVDVSYYDAQGKVVGRDSCPSDACPAIAPGGGWTFFQGSQPQLQPGYQGSAVVESDQPIVAVQARDVRRNGEFAIGADTTSLATGSSRLFLPLIANHDGPNRDWNGRFAVQNLSAYTACVTITYLGNGVDAEVAWDPYKPGAKNAKKEPGCANGGRPIAVGGTLFRDPDTFGLPEGFTGAVRIDTHKNGQGIDASKQLLTATADSWNSNSSHLATYRALAENEMGTTVVLPLVDREVGPFNGWSTHFQIENRDPSKPAQVTLRFEGYDINAGVAFVAKQNTFTVNASRMCFQDRDDLANCLAPGDRLPRTFVGTARLTSSQPIGVVVNRGAYYDATFTDYRGFRPEDATTRVLLPVLNKNYGPYQGHSGWNSWFRVLVADGGQATVRVRYVGLDLPGGEQSYTVSATREFTVFQPAERILPNGFAGTAILESDRPIVALANVYTDVFTGDTNFLYNGIALP